MTTDDERAEQRRARALSQWVADRMRDRGFNLQRVANRAGLDYRRISPILNGSSYRLTASQAAGLARAFDVSPTEVFVAAGLWESSTEAGEMPVELVALWRQLSEGERQTFMRMLRAVFADREERARLRADSADRAAYDADDPGAEDELA